MRHSKKCSTWLHWNVITVISVSTGIQFTVPGYSGFTQQVNFLTVMQAVTPGFHNRGRGLRKYDFPGRFPQRTISLPCYISRFFYYLFFKCVCMHKKDFSQWDSEQFDQRKNHDIQRKVVVGSDN